MKTPLHDAVRDYIEKDMSRFHMPGHKGAGTDEFAALLPWDITEVEGADSLYHAEGPLLALEEQFARLYGTRRTLLCAGGATLCIQTMLALACGTGAAVVMGRNLHRAAINAAALLDLTPVWVYPERDAGEWFTGRYSPAAVAAALDEAPAAKAVYLTSPDYFGVLSDLSGIAEVCRAHGVPLLVDNAHGAHLKFLPERYGKPHPADCGAALCCDSLHKTMPAMTGGALLHICDERYAPDAKRLMSMFGSTSPSYPILLSCERAAAYAGEGAAEGFERVSRAFDRARLLALQKGFAPPQGAADPAKLSLGFAARGMNAAGFGAWLRGFSIEPEYIGGAAGVLMATGFNRAEDFTRLETALGALPPSGASAPAPPPPLPRLEQALSVREAAFSTQERVSVENAAGRVAAGEVSPCPPGIPIVMPGERIDGAAVETLRGYGVTEVSVVSRGNF
ncbi:aminotransferase class I/II-fold pyridoxal phosphate-dependent enzyme [Anaerotruncus sp. DFI.9.16]|uniref:aminotransferase class I/II-fold pyridoxal phosphate-dependent enzyme n=1 Tax=Anaerotruncus sp. DFI.9.16 TaxID=2965275 RepID=UPI00210F10A4|nr:aminotransferase class I/II-fold pyridoxal phosphate-dependent enzyme [Anaerotruncus sp. DFI.9.16]MCQ4897301.1 aminotransferase class I/II-fold pyridoxal phosphate-dependent enzyme [Anaerotruncus sp. DFI.9.16]